MNHSNEKVPMFIISDKIETQSITHAKIKGGRVKTYHVTVSQIVGMSIVLPLLLLATWLFSGAYHTSTGFWTGYFFREAQYKAEKEGKDVHETWVVENGRLVEKKK